jgi:ATP-binding cassette subfamily B protein
MMKLVRFLKSTWAATLLAPLFMLFEVLMDLQQPQLMSAIVDNGVAKGDLPYVLAVGGQMLLVAALGVLGGLGCVFFSSISAMRFGTELRQSLFDKVQTFSFADLDTLKTSSLVTRLTNDVTQMQNLVMMVLRMAVRAPLMAVGGVVMAMLIDARLALILVVAVPILSVAIYVIFRLGFPLFRILQTRVDRINDVTRENLAGVRVVKVFVRQDHEVARFETANDALRNAGVKSSRMMIWLWPIMSIVMNTSIVAALWFGGNLFSIGGLQTGQIMAFINYLAQILMSLMMIAMLMLTISRAKASSDRINEVFDTNPSITDPEDAIQAEGFDIVFDDVSFTYPGAADKPALHHVSFTAREGETVGILGATGSGKTTLVSLIPRLYDATEGVVRIGGVDVRRIPQDTLRRNIGVALQQSTLFTGTVEENLRWGDPDAADETLAQAAEDAQAADFIQAMAEGYGSVVGQQGVNFSGGQKQRLSIARALLRNPKILILDDATSAVDMATEARLQAALKRRMGRCTILIIAQRISSVVDADRILVMDGGRIAAEGDHATLMRTSPIYRDIVRSQLGEEAVSHG